MSIWHRFLYWIGLRSDPGSRYFEISESLQTSLSTLASHEGRPEQKLAQDLLAAGLTQYYSTDEIWRKWESLTAREREVVALVCLEFTNREIGARLGISPETVKTRLHNAQRKFGLHTRSELRFLLVTIARWDFNEWLK